MNIIPVVVNSMSLQGENYLALSLQPTNHDVLPSWDAGAHIDVMLPNQIVRQYSLVGKYGDKSHYTICVKKEQVSRGGSQFIHEQLRVGHTLNISVPRNVFKLNDTAEYILIAGGIGITPILTMAEYLERHKKKFKLFYYVKNLHQVIFPERIYQNFNFGQVSIFCSNQGQSLRQGLPDAVQHVNDSAQVYMCGPQDFMEIYTTQLSQLGWNPACIFKEAFAPITKINQSEMTDTDCFKVKLRSTGQIFDVPADKSIANVLLEQQIQVPLSCEMGMCGACLTKVIAGDVMHLDTVQTEQEKSIQPQYIALCCSRSKSAVLEIDL